MNQAYLLIGGNMGNRPDNLVNAKKLLEEECGSIKKESSIYETAAWGINDQPAFLNQALLLQTNFSVTELMTCILNVEKQLGRIRKEKFGPRLIDIDIIFFNHEIYSDSLVTVPHPEMHKRRFVLTPLTEIAEQVIHPILQKSCFDLLCDCEDELIVKKFS